MNLDDPKIVAAFISAVVAIITVLLSFLLKSAYERHFHIFKLNSDHEYEQRKKIKEVIAKNKVQLLDAAESLNHRLWNLCENYEEQWHKCDNLNDLAQQYYPASFTYRLLAFFAWARKTEREMVYLDSTTATKEDLNFVKYLKLFPQVMCDVYLYSGLEYNKDIAKDHFFKDDFLHACDNFCHEDGVIQFYQYKENAKGALETSLSIADFINGVSPNENRLRWDRIQALHFVLMMFLNSFGYDYQRTDKEKLREITSKPRICRITNNLKILIVRYKLSTEKNIKEGLNVIGKL